MSSDCPWSNHTVSHFLCTHLIHVTDLIYVVAKSIREVCDNFVRPNSYTLDVDVRDTAWLGGQIV